MSWLRKSHLRLGLCVNAAYLIFYALGAASEAGLPRRALDAIRPAHREPTFYRRAPRAESAKVASYYRRETGETSVYPTEDLQLIAEPNRLLLLSPILYVKGAAVASPTAVLFRFYSVSSVNRYGSDRRVTLRADGVEVAPGTRVFYATSTTDEGAVGETISAEVPYEQFARALGARAVTLTVGRDEVELSPLQLEALRNMRRCVDAGGCR